jgi:acyl carrier protein
LREALEAAPPHQRKALLLDHLRRYTADILSYSDARAIDTRQPLTDLGLDSLMALDLKAKLERAVGRPLSSTLVFEHPTLEAIAAYLGQEVLDLAPNPAAPQSAASLASMNVVGVADLEDMSDQDAEVCLAAELDRLDEDRPEHRD